MKLCKHQRSKRVNEFSHHSSPRFPAATDARQGRLPFLFFGHQFSGGILQKGEFEFSVLTLNGKEMKALQQATPTQKMAHVDPERCQLLFDDTSVKLSAH